MVGAGRAVVNSLVNTHISPPLPPKKKHPQKKKDKNKATTKQQQNKQQQNNNKNTAQKYLNDDINVWYSTLYIFTIS